MMSEIIRIEAHAGSNADSLGYMGQQAVAQAVDGDTPYRIIGGHMVRLLLHVYPTSNATLRSTIDADAAVDDIEIVGDIVDGLCAQDFSQTGGNVLKKAVNSEQNIEVNLLVSRRGSSKGIRSECAPGVGQVDTLPELGFALDQPPLDLEVFATLFDGSTIEYRTRIPGLETAVVLKAHSWKARGLRSDRDLADLHSLMEIREEHPHTAWGLSSPGLIGFRKDTARILHEAAGKLTKRTSNLPVPYDLDRVRMAALIARHVSRP